MRLAAVGDNCMDVYYKMNKAFPGGGPVNTGVYTIRMGGTVSYMGAVGTDKYGELMISELKNKGIDVSHVKVLEGSTAVTMVEITDGNRVFGDYFEGVLTQFKLNDDDINFIGKHDFLHTSIYGRIENDLPRIKKLGIPISFDFSDKYDSPVTKKAISNVDYAFFSFEEDPSDRVKNFIKEMQEKGPKVVVATLGSHGSIAYDGKEYYSCGVIPVNVVDTMGAGDSFIAGFIMGIHEGVGVKKAMEMGAESSAITIQYFGAWPLSNEDKK